MGVSAGCTAGVLEAPLVSFGREVCGDLAAGLRREWLVTNGLGGYASGTLAGVGTRRYHGLLVAALTPPAVRTVLVAGLDDWAIVGDTRFPLCSHEWASGALMPEGYRWLEAFELRGQLPVWTFALDELRLERRVWMAQESNTAYVSYRHARGSRAIALELRPLCTYRDFHTLTQGGWTPGLAVEPDAVTLTAWPGAQPYRLDLATGRFQSAPDWYWGFRRRAETERGLDDREDLFVPGVFFATLGPGQEQILVLSAGEPPAVEPDQALAVERARQEALLRRAGVEAAPRVIQQLVLAADQFLVKRQIGSGQSGRTIIAGYHWFGDWGRDTMISLPGLALATGRPEEAADVLDTYARYLSQGMLPNRFPDDGAEPEYNSVDATLWLFQAVRQYAVTGDRELIDRLIPLLRDVIEWHCRGTRHGIALDPADGLLRAGEDGYALTWMDARIDGKGCTARIGKPVEINALWHAALRTLAALLAERGDPAAARYTALAEQAAASFRARFWKPELGYLADVVDTPEGSDDVSLRPNQLLALSLPYPLLAPEQARAVLKTVGQHLLTSYGLRSLAPSDPRYHGAYGGSQRERDGAYHQGTAWTWLLGPYAEAYARVTGDRSTARSLLQPLAHHLCDAGLGTVSEILDGDPPHTPRGCIAQAWGVAEALRVWRALT